MSTEIWQEIRGYEGLYKVSNLGRVKSENRVVMRGNGVPQYQRKCGENRKREHLSLYVAATGRFSSQSATRHER